MFEDATPFSISDFNGLWSRGEENNVPLDHLVVADNCKFEPGNVTVRDGVVSDTIAPSIRRYYNYKIPGLAPRKIILTVGGALYDSLNLAVPLIIIPNMIDFSMVVWNNRAYISPHDRVRGLSGQVVYVYDGVTFRPAGGLPPAGFTLGVTTSTNNGKVETGDHFFAIAYETESGFITKMGPDIWTRYTAPGGFKAVISNIPIGPTGTIARHILASKKIPSTFSGNQEDVELFFVEGGVIENNITDSWEVDFYDSDLVRSADYLLDQMDNIPACLGLGVYKNSMIFWNTQTHENVIYFSRANEPESVDQVEGYMEIKDDEKKQGVKACVEFRQQLYIHKSTRSYVTEATSSSPVFWPFSGVDRGIGTEVYGISKIVDVEGTTTDLYSLVDRSGIRVFTGTFSLELTYKIRKFWKSVNKAYLSTSQFYIDATNFRIFINLPINGANSPNCILYGDYSEGLDPLKIKWSVWTFAFSPTSISLDLDDNNIPYLNIGSINDNIYNQIDGRKNDNGLAINWITQFPYVGSSNGETFQFIGTRLRVRGSGVLRPTVYALDKIRSVNPPAWNITLLPGGFIERQFGIQSPNVSLKLSTTLFDEYMIISEVILYGAPLWSGK